MYGRSATTDRWASSGQDSLLSSFRQELPWTAALHSSHPSIPRRRDSHLPQTDSWSNLPNSSGRWLGSHDSSNTQGSPYLEQRARIRSSHPYEEAASLRRDPENLSPSYSSHRFQGHCSSRDSAPHRGLAWHQRDLDTLKSERGHTDTSYSPSPTLPFSTSGYQQSHQHHHSTPTHTYSSSWSSTEMETPASLQALPSQSTLSTYDTSYATDSATMSTSGDFPANNVDDM
jgi:hypothetical protein